MVISADFCDLDWIFKQVEQHGGEYQNQSWGPVIALVRNNRPPVGRVMAAKDKGAVKEMFLTLNNYLQVRHHWPDVYLCAVSISVRILLLDDATIWFTHTPLTVMATLLGCSGLWKDKICSACD